MKHIYSIIIIYITAITSAYSQSCTMPMLADATSGGTTPIAMSCGGGVANMTVTFNGQSGVSTNQYSVSSIPHVFTSFSGTTIPISSDDVWSSTIPLPFSFCFFGNTYNSLLIGSNGLVSFDVSPAGGYCTYVVTTIPGTTLPRASIMGVYNDIDPRFGASTRRIQYTTIGTAPCRQFIVSFEDIAYYSSTCAGTYANYQIVLYESTNIVETHIRNHNGCSSTNSGRGIIGIQNWDRTVAYPAPGRNNTTFTTANESWRFTPSDTSNPFRRMIVHLFDNGVLVDSAVPYYSPFPTLRADFTRNIVFPPDSHWMSAQLIIRDSAGTGSGTSLCAVSSSLYDFNDLLYYNSGSLNLTQQITNVNCNSGTDGAIDLTAVSTSPPINYTWSDGPVSEDRSGLSAGIYTVTASDGGGCTITRSFTVSEPAPLMIMLDSIRHVACLGDNTGHIEITAMGGTLPYSYTWTGGAITEDIYSLTAGMYDIMLIDSHGCDENASYIVLPGRIDTATTYRNICSGDQIFLGGAWRNTAGNYYDTLVSSHGCDSVLTTVLSITSFSTNTINASICDGDSFTFNSITYFSSGSYFDTLVSYTGCDSIVRINLTVNSATNGSRTLRGCPGDLFFVGGANQSSPGTYYDTLVNIYGCDSILASTITYYTTSSASRSVTICSGNTYFCGGANQSTPGTYYDTLVNSTGCDSILSTILTVNPTSSTSELYSKCFGSTFMGFVVLQDTVITQTYTNIYGCDSTNSIMITVLPQPIADAGTDQSINLGDSATLNASGGIYYSWSTGTTNATTTVGPSSTTTYYVTVTNSDSCQSSDSVIVTVTYPSTDLVMPEAFTPNGDNLNDKLLPINATDFDINPFIIFNRWGNEVYHVTSNTDGWDGTFLNAKQEVGTYVYYIKAVSKTNGEEVIKQGVVTLIR